jgi:hypothetical protein
MSSTRKNRASVAAVQSAANVPSIDVKAVVLAGRPGSHLPAEELTIEVTRRGWVLDA